MVTERRIPGYCRGCMHWTTTHGLDGCRYKGCGCSVGADVLMSSNHLVQKKNSGGNA